MRPKNRAHPKAFCLMFSVLEQDLKKNAFLWTKRMQQFGMMSLENRRTFLDLSFLFKIFRNKIDCSQLLEKFKFRVPRRTRNPITPFCPPLCYTTLGGNSVVSRLSKVINEGQFDVFADSFARLKAELLVLEKTHKGGGAVAHPAESFQIQIAKNAMRARANIYKVARGLPDASRDTLSVETVRIITLARTRSS
ncbi:hypothetical protein ACJJTC_014110 [Scirpophaga incertulas]